MSKTESRLKYKHTVTKTSKLTDGEVEFLQQLGGWLKTWKGTNPLGPKDYNDVLKAGLQAQVYNSAGNCRRWCYDDDNDPYCCG
jgi:hypothetical protein